MRQKSSLFRLRALNVKVATFLISATLLFPIFVGQASAFRIFGPNPGAAGDYVSELNPNDFPPFVHWDLREFNNCEVPWSITNNHPDLDGDGLTGPNDPIERLAVFTAVWDAFQEWEDVGPAVIGFVLGNRWGAVPAGVQGIQLDDYNLIDWVPAVGGDDIQGVDNPPLGNFPGPEDNPVLVGGAPAPGGICVTAGPNGFLETQPRDDDWIDFIVVPHVIRSADGICETTANNQGPLGVLVALTGLFFDNSTGVIREVDIVFNSAETWSNTVPVPGGACDIQTVAAHEIGHFIGMAHPVAPVGELMDPVVCPGLLKRAAVPDDEDGINFLYTPDMGDAPDPYIGVFNRYPSLVHSLNPGRMLNGVQLFFPALGAEHLFGFFGGAVVPPRYQYEWLGTFPPPVNRIDDNPLECEALVPGGDAFDDGVTFGGAFVPGGPPVPVTINVRTSADITGGAHVYGPGNPMYINGWFDWNADGDWADAGEHVIGAAAGAVAVFGPGPNVFMVAAPAGAKPCGWARFRLDYMEDVGQVGVPIDPTLFLETGAAQFGEVEDYKIPFAHVTCSFQPFGTERCRGGTLMFQAYAHNDTDESQTFQFATFVTLPNGHRYPTSGYLLGPVTVTLNPQESISKYLTQFIPFNAPFGTYTYHGYVGKASCPLLYNQCQFNFTVKP